jgi:hypothetical protein
MCTLDIVWPSHFPLNNMPLRRFRKIRQISSWLERTTRTVPGSRLSIGIRRICATGVWIGWVGCGIWRVGHIGRIDIRRIGRIGIGAATDSVDDPDDAPSDLEAFERGADACGEEERGNGRADEFAEPLSGTFLRPDIARDQPCLKQD